MLYEELLIPIFHEVILSVLNANPGIVRECISALKSVCSDLIYCTLLLQQVQNIENLFSVFP